jgi:hypothetical protein
VFAGKGSLRRAKPRRALACCAPFRPDHYAMGGSGGITGTSVTAAKKQNAGVAWVLDRVAPHQFSSDIFRASCIAASGVVLVPISVSKYPRYFSSRRTRIM